jgi:hypothetical protein
MRTIDKFDKIGQEKVEAELKELGLSDAVVNTIIKFILISGTVDEKIALLEKLNIDEPTFIEGLNELKEVVNETRKIANSVEIMAKEMVHMNAKIDKIDSKVEMHHTDNPNKLIFNIKNAIIVGIATAILTAIMALIFK